MGSTTDMNTVRPQQPGCSKDEWCWLFPQPQGNTLWSVWGSSANDAWAAGERHPAALHQRKLEVRPQPDQEPALCPVGVDANDIYAVGDRGVVLHYDGQTWTPMTISAAPPSRCAVLGLGQRQRRRLGGRRQRRGPASRAARSAA